MLVATEVVICMSWFFDNDEGVESEPEFCDLDDEEDREFEDNNHEESDSGEDDEEDRETEEHNYDHAHSHLDEESSISDDGGDLSDGSYLLRLESREHTEKLSMRQVHQKRDSASLAVALGGGNKRGQSSGGGGGVEMYRRASGHDRSARMSTCVFLTPHLVKMVQECLHKEQLHLVFLSSSVHQPSGTLRPNCDCCFSPDGLTLLTCTGCNIGVWDVNDGLHLQNLEGHTHDVRKVCFSPHGLFILSASDDHSLKLWESERKMRKRPSRRARSGENLSPSCGLKATSRAPFSGDLQRTLVGHKREVTCCCLSLENELQRMLVLSGSADGVLKLWDARTGLCTLTVELDKGSAVVACLFSLDGRYFWVALSDRTLREYSVDDCQLLRSLVVVDDASTELGVCSFSTDGKRVLCGSSVSLQLWHLDIGKLIHTLPHPNDVLCCCFCQNVGLILSASTHSPLMLWKEATGEPYQIIDNTTCLDTRDLLISVVGCTFSPDGKLLVAMYSTGQIACWKLHISTG